MTRALILSGLMLTAVTVGGCNTVFAPIQPEVVSPAERLERAERDRQRSGQTHPDCLADRRGRSAQEQDRLRDACERLRRDK